MLIGLLGVIVILLVTLSYYYLKEPSEFSYSKKKDSPTEQKQSDKKEKVPEVRNTPKEKSPPPNKSSEKAIVEEKETKVEEKKTNTKLPDYKGVDEYYFTSSFDFAWPAYDVNDLIVEHEGFTLNYDEKNEQATWVAYKLERKNLENARFKRRDNFREDNLVSTGSASPKDYAKSGYDRGHLAPAADFTWSKTALDHTFFMSNMSPQEPSFNRGVWKKLEEQVRIWAKKNNSIYVVTGPVIEKRAKRIGTNKVTVPQYYYKAILDIQEPELKAIGFLMKNQKSDNKVLSFAVTIDKLELVTGLDFFPSLPDEMESKLEGSINVKLWE